MCHAGSSPPQPCPTSHPSTKALHISKLPDTPHIPGFVSTAFTCKALAGPETTTGSSHDVEEIQNRDIPSPAPFSFTKIAAMPQFLCCCDSYPIEYGILQVDSSCSPATQPGWGNCRQGGKGTHMEKAGKHGIPSALAINKIKFQQKERGWSPNCPTVTLDLLVLVVCTFHQFHEATAKHFGSTVCPLLCSPG